MVSVIQVGTGRWGGNWAQEILPTVPEISVTAHVDANPAALEALQAKTSIPAARCFASLEAALDAVPCDIVLGTLRTEAHYPVMRQALEAGKHAIVEKPFASTLAEAAALNRLARERGLIMAVSQNYRFYRAPRRAAALLTAGTIGAVDHLAIDFRRHGPSMGYAYYEFPDPLIADMAIHHFDLMRMVLGSEAQRVSCRTWNPPGSPFHHDPAGALLIEFGSGVMVTYRGSWMSAGSDTPWSGNWAINGQKGEIAMAFRGDAGADRSKVDGLTLRPLGGEHAPQQMDALRHYDRAGAIAAIAEAVRTGVAPPYFPSGEDNLHSLALVKACTLSASRGGAWVEMDEVMQQAEGVLA
jgi:predicted dehydrogenase